MVTHTPTHPRRDHRPQRLLDRRYLGICGRYWVITGILLAFGLGIYKVSTPISQNAFDQPGAQIPNQLRSPWGVKNPI